MNQILMVEDKKKKKTNGTYETIEGEIDLILSENGILYPVKIKLSSSPKADMASHFDVLDKIPDQKRGMGAIVCLYDKKLYLRDNLVVLPVEYI